MTTTDGSGNASISVVSRAHALRQLAVPDRYSINAPLFDSFRGITKVLILPRAAPGGQLAMDHTRSEQRTHRVDQNIRLKDR